MILKTNKFVAFASAALLSMVGVGAISTPAHALCRGQEVADPKSNDKPQYNIRLISPILTDENSIRRYDFESEFTNDCDWFGVGMRFTQVYVPFGLTTNLTFQVTSPSNVPVSNKKVTLRANKGWSKSNANGKVNGVTPRPAPESPVDGARVAATTDVNGVVNFVIQSPSDCTIYGGTLPDAPGNLTEPTANDRNSDSTTDCFSQFLPEVTTEKTDSADFVELHYYNPAGLNFDVTDATLSLLAPTLRTVDGPSGKANAFDKSGITAKYAPIGSKQVVAFQALKSDGSYARNQSVTIRINLANSGAKAKTAAGIFTAIGFVSPRPANASKLTEDQLELTGSTDAFGVVTFSLNNTDTYSIAAPKTPTSAPATGTRFSSFSAEITGRAATVTSPVEFHYFKPIPPTSIAAVAKARKITVTLSYAKGKRSVVSITGLKSVAVTPTVDKKSYTYTVKKGKITVKVTSNGKTLTKVFTVK